jgi:hypothetical protein
MKSFTSAPPPAQPWRGKGADGRFLWNPEDLLHENGSYTDIIIKSTLKLKFLLKTSETKYFFKNQKCLSKYL